MSLDDVVVDEHRAFARDGARWRVLVPGNGNLPDEASVERPLQLLRDFNRTIAGRVGPLPDS
jgi:hypothetical protein